MTKETLISAARIAQRTKELATELSPHISSLGENVVLIPVLEGAAPFAVMLSEELYELGHDLPQKSIAVTSYDQAMTSSRNPKVMTLFKEGQLSGKHAIVVEDVVDTGHTLKFLVEFLLKEMGCASVTLVALLAKTGAQEVELDVPYVGFWIENVWVEGFGIDTQGLGRGQKDIQMVIPEKVDVESV